jgi:quinoprotein glucose dehydrogenase
MFKSFSGLFCILALPAAFAATEPEAASAIKKFTVADGLEVSVWAAEPLLSNPVSFSFDESGHAFVAETHRLNNSVFDITQNTNWLHADLSFETVGQRKEFLENTFGANVGTLTKHSERLQMITAPSLGAPAQSSQTIAENFNQVESGLAAGVLAHGTNLWFSCIPDLWRFIDSNADGIPDEGKKLHSGFGVHIGVTGHDLHGLTMGPDGRIYFSIGDRGFNIEEKGKHFAFPHTGGVLRCDPDGSNLEVFAVGLRNPQELAFDDHGNLFAGDNDTAGPDNCRLIYVVRDGDYGWRCSYQHMNGFGPWVIENLWHGGQDGMLPHSGNPAQGPSGLAFYPGTGLPDSFQNHFFICDFPGGIWSFEVKPNGASFEMTNRQKFVWNTWPTDVEFGPNDGIYFSDWVGGWNMPEKGRIYRVRAKGGIDNHKTTELIAANFTNLPENKLVDLLAFADLRIRQEAQFELVNRGALRTLVKVAGEGSSEHSRLHAVWGLGQLGRKNPEALRASWATLQGLLKDGDPEIRAQVARLAAEAQIQNSAEQLEPLLEDSSPRVRFFAAEALEKLGAKNALPKMIEMAKASPEDAFLQHPVILAVSRMGDENLLKSLANDNEVAGRRIALLAMRRNTNAAVAQFLADEKLAVEAARAINDQPITEAFPKLAAFAVNAQTPKPVLWRVLNANFRIGGLEAAQRLAEFAAHKEYPENLRAEALEMLADWKKPDEVDRVVGLWRPIPERKADDAREALIGKFPGIATESSETILSALLAGVERLGCKVDPSILAGIFQKEKNPASVRIQALRSIASLEKAAGVEMIRKALSSKEASIRALACTLAAENPQQDSIEKLVQLARNDADISVKKAALKSLYNCNGSNVDKLFEDLASAMRGGTFPKELSLELLEGLKASKNPAVQALSSALESNRNAALLAGGNVERGSRIFHDRADVSCLRCHALNGAGGTVGPDLAGIGSRQTREYLLEAVEFPNKAIAKGFEQVVIAKKDGTGVAGLVKKETDETLTIESPEDGLIEVKTAEIKSRQRTLSAMPEGLGGMLTPFELRDLIEYLASLK